MQGELQQMKQPLDALANIGIATLIELPERNIC